MVSGSAEAASTAAETKSAAKAIVIADQYAGCIFITCHLDSTAVGLEGWCVCEVPPGNFGECCRSQNRSITAPDPRAHPSPARSRTSCYFGKRSLLHEHHVPEDVDD